MADIDSQGIPPSGKDLQNRGVRTFLHDIGTTAVVDGLFDSTGGLYRTGQRSYEARTLTGDTNEISITNPDGIAADPVIGLADNPVVPGTNGMTLPSGTTPEGSLDSLAGTIRHNTQNGGLEHFNGNSWGSIGATFISSTDLSGLAAIEFSVLGFDSIMLRYEFQPSTDGIYLLARFRQVNASTVMSGASDYARALQSISDATSTQQDTTSSFIAVCGHTAHTIGNADGGAAGTCTVHIDEDGNRTPKISVETTWGRTNGAYAQGTGGGFLNSDTSIESVELSLSSGTFASGKISMYGMKG